MGVRTLTYNKIMFIKALQREVRPSRWWSGKSNTFLNRGLVAI